MYDALLIELIDAPSVASAVLLRLDTLQTIISALQDAIALRKRVQELENTAEVAEKSTDVQTESTPE